MAYDYHKDSPPILFTTFKPIPQNKDVPGSHAAYHEGASPPTEMATEAKNKNSSSPTIFVHNTTSRSPGATLKEQTYQWFERTQRRKLMKNGRFADWFHGFITRSRAEEILEDGPPGCFLIRFCESRVGFVLSYRGTERCRHFMLNQLEDEQYEIEGEKSVHPSLEDLVNHYSRFPVEPYKEMLTTACPKSPPIPNVSSLPQHNPQDAAAGDKTYARISKQNQAPPDDALPLSSSPNERNKEFCDGKVPVEYAAPSFAKKVPPFPKKKLVLGPQDLDPPLAYAPTKMPSDHESDEEDEPRSVPSTYSPSDEVHTYSEAAFSDRPGLESSDVESELIAFYAIGRGSCKDNLENVYSEVDVNSITSCKPKAAVSRLPGLSTLPHPAPKAVKHKTSAFHASFHSRKPAAAPPGDARRGHFSKSNTKPHAALQLDDPAYGKGHVQHRSPPNMEEEENIYEKIPENCVTTKKNPPGRKAR